MCVEAVSDTSLHVKHIGAGRSRMACQKVYKQGRDDIIVKVNLQSPIPIHLFTLQLQTIVKMMQGCGFVNLPSLLYHPYLVCTLFGMPSLHPFTFLMFLSLLALLLMMTTGMQLTTIG